MQARHWTTTTALGLLAAILLVIGTAVTSDRIPAFAELHAQPSWRGLVIAPKQRCAPYEADDYPQPAVGRGPDHR